MDNLDTKKSVDFLIKENETLKVMLKESQESISSLEDTLATYENFITVDQFAVVESRLAEYKGILDKFGSLENIQESMDELSAYRSVGTLVECKESLNAKSVELSESDAEELGRYRCLGSVDEIKEASDKAADILESYMNLGTIEQIQEASDKAADILESYTNLGTPEFIREKTDEAAAILESYMDLGTVEQLSESVKCAKALDDLGYTVESVEDVLKERAELAAKERVNSLVESYNISESAAESTLKMYNDNVDEAKEYLESLNLKRDNLIGKSVIKDTNESVGSKKSTQKTTFNTMLKYFK